MVQELKAVLADQERMLADDRDTTSRGDSKRSRAVVEEMLARLAADLVALSERNLTVLALPEAVADVVIDARAMKVGGARNRQLRLVRRELRDCDWFSIRARLQHLLQHGTLDGFAAPGEERAVLSPEAEWTVRLLSQGKPALDALLAEFARADRDHFLELLREVRVAKPHRRGKAEQRLTATIAALLRDAK